MALDASTPWFQSPQRLSLLLDLIGRINSKLDLQSLLAAIMEAAKTIMDAEASSLLMLDRATGELVITVPTGPAGAEISGARIPPGEGLGGWVVRQRSHLVVADVQQDPRFFGDLTRSGFKTRNMICVPMKGPDGEITGVLQAINKRDGGIFTEADVPLFAALADHAAVAIETARLHKEALAKQRLDEQLRLAREIQEGFLPKEVPTFPGITLAGKAVPAADVGGDYYDFIPLTDKRCVLVIADISGKGIPAALLMASLRAALRTQIESGLKLPEVVSMINRILVRETPAERFVTLFCAEVDLERGVLTYINGGHNPPILFDRESGETRLLEIGGPIVGCLNGLRFETGVEKLKKGHTLVLYTDGMTEAENQDEDMFGEERFLSEVRKRASPGIPAEELIGALFEEVTAFVKGAPQHDDMTLLVMTVDA
jgi:phosphoserine phosphatase RsbU/P